jgi:hypothetical protein
LKFEPGVNANAFPNSIVLQPDSHVPRQAFGGAFTAFAFLVKAIAISVMGEHPSRTFGALAPQGMADTLLPLGGLFVSP